VRRGPLLAEGVPPPSCRGPVGPAQGEGSPNPIDGPLRCARSRRRGGHPLGPKRGPVRRNYHPPRDGARPGRCDLAEKKTDQILRRQEWLDGWGEGIQKLVGGIYKGLGPLSKPLRNLLSGTSVFGHPL